MHRLILLLVSITTIDLSAHEFNPAHLVINESNVDSWQYDAIWMYPVKNIGKRAEVIFSDKCLANQTDFFIQGKYIIENIDLNCSTSLKGLPIEIKDLSVLIDALITINFKNDTFEGIVNVQNSSIEIPLDINYYPTAYLSLGFDHLFDGLDHILFLVGLLFCVLGLLNLIKTITAFTLAHSITLGLSVFGLVVLPQSTVEALIALTIIFLAYDLSSGVEFKRTPWIMAFGFGLLHGLGFASALSEIGVANNNMFLSLLFFNIGIELAQISLIPIPLIIIHISKKYNYLSNLKLAMGFLIGGFGFYWFIDRVIGIIL